MVLDISETAIQSSRRLESSAIVDISSILENRDEPSPMREAAGAR